jgi:predicted nucleic acid-binding protein
MRASRCTIDSSCIIALDHLDLVPELSLLFSIVLVPRAVRSELFKRPDTQDRLERIFDDYSFFQRCDDYEQGTVDILLKERTREEGQDRGEVETVVQASELGAIVIVDDLWGRKLAEHYDLEVHGTLWVLQRLHELNLLSSTVLRESFVSLCLRGTRLPWDIVNTLLAHIGQQPI